MSVATLRSPPLSSRGQADDSERNALFHIIRNLSFGRGTITLSSGRHSDFYFDMKPSMLDPEGAQLMAKLLTAQVLAADGEYVGGLEMGAVPITGAICSYSFSAGTPIKGFFVRKKPKEHGAKKQLEGFSNGEGVKGKRLVIVDDVTTSGASALQAVKACNQAGADVRMVISIVDRGEGAAEAFAVEGIPFMSLFNASDFLNYRG
jgi:orotate phosphoribosyltransferase